MKLHAEMPEQVTCIAVNLDFDGRKTRPPESYEEEILAFLESVNGTGFASYVCTTASDDVFVEAKLPSIPVVMIFDKNGELATSFVDGGETAGFSYEKDIIPAVRGMIQ